MAPLQRVSRVPLHGARTVLTFALLVVVVCGALLMQVVSAQLYQAYDVDNGEQYGVQTMLSGNDACSFGVSVVWNATQAGHAYVYANADSGSSGSSGSSGTGGAVECGSWFPYDGSDINGDTLCSVSTTQASGACAADVTVYADSAYGLFCAMSVMDMVDSTRATATSVAVFSAGGGNSSDCTDVLGLGDGGGGGDSSFSDAVRYAANLIAASASSQRYHSVRDVPRASVRPASVYADTEAARFVQRRIAATTSTSSAASAWKDGFNTTCTYNMELVRFTYPYWSGIFLEVCVIAAWNEDDGSAVWAIKIDGGDGDKEYDNPALALRVEAGGAMPATACAWETDFQYCLQFVPGAGTQVGEHGMCGAVNLLYAEDNYDDAELVEFSVLAYMEVGDVQGTSCSAGAVQV